MYRIVNGWRYPGMKIVTFTEFRQNAATYFDAVEHGETIKVLRHGKPIAEIVPASTEEKNLSWKQPGLKLSVKGASLSREILKERKQSKR
jgi:prevent-host-death family protein